MQIRLKCQPSHSHSPSLLLVMVTTILCHLACKPVWISERFFSSSLTKLLFFQLPSHMDNTFCYSLSHVEWSIGFLTSHWYGYMKLGPFSHNWSLAPSSGHKLIGILPFFKTFLLIRLTPFVHACHDKFCWPPTFQIMIFAYFRVPYVMKICAI